MVTILLLTILYTQIGYQLSKQGWKAWKKKEQKSLRSLLFFPVHRARRLVGKNGFFATQRDDEILYKVYMTLGWPVDMAWNLTALIGFVGPDMAINRLLKGKEPAGLKAGRLSRTIRRLEAAAEKSFDARLEKAVETAKKALPAKAKKRGKKLRSGGKERVDQRALPEMTRLRVVPEPADPANRNIDDDDDDDDDDEAPASASRHIGGRRK